MLANDNDADGDPLAVTGVTAATGTNGTVTLSGNASLVTYTPKANFTGQDQFTYIVNDGAGSSATGTVVVTVTLPNMLSLNHVTIAPTANGRRLRFLGTPAQNYIVLKAGTVAGPWSNLSPSIPADGTGLVQFEDTNAPLPAVRFYRLATVP